ncbi:hypothetical protein AAFF_G00035400 [Aldrovandia affinis]|uniref:Uncharacterized protein n=1 Tax=Aldrovandia affinis TaxID=143900 RepID=A0AAD7WGG3_9TELE|nr:hypothetical protein AAFF_G00035400 [Aldrovandia affinis]
MLEVVEQERIRRPDEAPAPPKAGGNSAEEGLQCRGDLMDSAIDPELYLGRLVEMRPLLHRDTRGLPGN